MARHTAMRSHAGDQARLRMSRQISPVRKWTFAWKTGVTNSTRGGTIGYSSPTTMRSSNTPGPGGVVGNR